MDKVYKRQTVRSRRRCIRTFVVAITLLAILIVLVTTSCRREDTVVSEETIQANIDALEAQRTTIVEEDTIHIIPYTEIDWEEIIIQAAMDGDAYSGTSAEEQMIAAGMDNTLHYHELVELAKIMQEEDGIEWPDWAIMAIGEVVLNRVASPEFPESISAVLRQINPVQYAPVQTARWQTIQPQERYVRLAARLLKGERVLCNEQIVYQALFPQGGGAVLTYKDLALGSTTYFCLTDYPELYG